MIALVALIGVVILGGGGAYWAYKKIQAKRHQEVQYEARIPIWDGFEKAAFTAAVLSDNSLEKIVEANNLVSFWSVPDVAAAKTRITENFSVKVVDGVVRAGYKDKDDGMAKKILMGLMNGFQDKVKAAAGAGG